MGDDLCSSFYLFRLPDAWKAFLAFERQVSWRVLGAYMSAVVLPMGFASSAGLMQHIRRRLALAGGGLPAAQERGKIGDGQSWMKGRLWPIIFSSNRPIYRGSSCNNKKAIEESEQAERLGSFLDGRRESR